MNMRLTVSRTWRVPIALAFISTCGLLTGLLFDGIGDAVSWLALAIPVAVAVGFGKVGLCAVFGVKQSLRRSCRCAAKIGGHQCPKTAIYFTRVS